MRLTSIKVNGQVICYAAPGSRISYEVAKDMMRERVREEYPNCHCLLARSGDGFIELVAITPDDLSIMAIDPD